MDEHVEIDLGVEVWLDMAWHDIHLSCQVIVGNAVDLHLLYVFLVLEHFGEELFHGDDAILLFDAFV